jgi:cell division protein FtsW
MARKLATDKVLFVPLVALSLFGCVMIYSASAVSAGETSGSPYRYLVKQIAALVVGGIAAFVVSRTDYRFFSRPWVAYVAFGGAFALCGAALLQPPINAARRWIPVGPVMVQPSELLKVALVVLLASLIARKTLESGDPQRAVKPALFFTVLAAGIVLLEPDLGTAACYVMLVAVLLWVAGVRAKLFLALGAASLLLVAAAALGADYRRARLLSFLNPEADPLGSGFQALQSLIADGAGGGIGKGIGASRRKRFFLP